MHLDREVDFQLLGSGGGHMSPALHLQNPCLVYRCCALIWWTALGHPMELFVPLHILSRVPTFSGISLPFPHSFSTVFLALFEFVFFWFKLMILCSTSSLWSSGLCFLLCNFLVHISLLLGSSPKHFPNRFEGSQLAMDVHICPCYLLRLSSNNLVYYGLSW